MKSFLLVSLLIILLGGTIRSQTQDANEITVGIGTSKSLKDTEIKFVEVLEDSRCPEGSTCKWAGNARVRIEVIRFDKTSRIFELDSNGANTHADFDRFRISLKALDPHPKGDKPIERAAYKATLVITPLN